MKLAVVGSRTFKQGDLMRSELSKYKIDTIISGGAKGADQEAEKYARENNVQVELYLPEYDRYGRGAPLKRNELIVNACDQLIAFWDMKSRGTKYTIDYARKQGKQIKIIKI
jgi:predicted Rossmann fold nucleotide-binding protein DprA/Smf involved in DNA uptake